MRAVPLVDLAAQHAEISGEVASGWEAVLSSMGLIGGAFVADFEAGFASFQGVAHCVGVANGTDAIELALRALGVGKGDEVIVPANSFIATALAVLRAGATPVLVDCDPQHYLMTAESVACKLSSATRVLVPVHLFGQMAPVEQLKALDPNLLVIEDAAQAHGARRLGRAAGSWGDAGAISFYPGKNLGAYGDAGAVLTESEAVAARVRALRNYGSERKYYHPEIGFNSRLDPLQAVVLAAKLKRLNRWNEMRCALAQRYDEMLGGIEEVQRPFVLEGNCHVWHLYVVRVPNRDQVVRALHNAGIEAGIHYPVPMHLQGALSFLGHRAGDFPEAEAAAGSMISLPMYPHLSADAQLRVVEALTRALRT